MTVKPAAEDGDGGSQAGQRQNARFTSAVSLL